MLHKEMLQGRLIFLGAKPTIVRTRAHNCFKSLFWIGGIDLNCILYDMPCIC